MYGFNGLAGQGTGSNLAKQARMIHATNMETVDRFGGARPTVEEKRCFDLLVDYVESFGEDVLNINIGLVADIKVLEKAKEIEVGDVE